MYTVNKSIYNVRALLKGYSDDFRPTNRMIFGRLKANRNLLINRENNKGKLFNSSALQNINCIPMCTVDISECCDIKTGVKVSRSTDVLPKILDTAFDHRAITLHTIDRSSKIDLKSMDVIIAQLTKKYKYPSPSAFISNDYLYIFDTIYAIAAQGIFENPEEIQDLNTCKTYDDCGNVIEEGCATPELEKEFNCPGYLIEAIENKTAKDIAQFYGYAVEDKNNDAKNDSAK